jgi:hypothetical protein
MQSGYPLVLLRDSLYSISPDIYYVFYLTRAVVTLASPVHLDDSSTTSRAETGYGSLSARLGYSR